MIAIIIAGGAGSRLWPLSTSEKPKHLLQLGGAKRSLLQATYARAERLTKDVHVVTVENHADLVREQLPKMPTDCCIMEPARRGTANCIVAALARLAKAGKTDEPVIFMHADHYIRDARGFAHSARLAGKVSSQYKKIVLIGVEPTRPSTGFGYIEKGDLIDDERFVFAVKSFQEKPDFATAQEYEQSGNYLWNCGYFVGSVEVFVSAMEQYAPDLKVTYDRLLEATGTDSFNEVYAALESDTIDYALSEKVEDLLVLPASFDWMDLGSYKDLAKAIGGDEMGNHLYGGRIAIDDVKNSFIQNHEDKPLAVIGLDNCVVINTPNGILVMRKDLSQRVGDIGKQLS